jgi:hypothetical protein
VGGIGRNASVSPVRDRGGGFASGQLLVMENVHRSGFPGIEGKRAGPIGFGPIPNNQLRPIQIQH